jgi:hypothetical protein
MKLSAYAVPGERKACRGERADVPDGLLDVLTLTLVDTGSHSDIFNN